MTKFKKFLLSVLAFVLTLGMIFQATPAFARGTQTLLPPRSPQTALATIKSMTVLEIYPPQLKITGTLPSPCYQVNVSTQVVSSISASTALGMVFVRVRGVAPFGILCARGVKTFTTTVTLDPVKLGLAPGRYMAMVNPVNGQSQFKMAFTIPAPRLETALATITKLTVLESYPPQYKISGMLPSTCHTLHVSAPQVTGSVISVFLRGAKPAGVFCPMTLKPFSTILTIDPVKLKLTRGTTYTVLFNPVNGVSRFKAEVPFGLD